MGILRADRITGLGGANAITGSCFFDVKNYLLISHDISSLKSSMRPKFSP